MSDDIENMLQAMSSKFQEQFASRLPQTISTLKQQQQSSHQQKDEDFGQKECIQETISQQQVYRKQQSMSEQMLPCSGEQISLNVSNYTAIKIPFPQQQQQAESVRGEMRSIEQVQEDDYYRPLTQKLESVYKQIMKQQQPQSRMEYYQRRKQAKQRALMEEREARMVKELTYKPLLNSKSRDMLQNYSPIYERFNQVIEAKEKKLERCREERRVEKEMEEQQIINHMEQHRQQVIKKYQNVRSADEYVSYMDAWGRKLQMEREENKSRGEEAIKQMCRFTPQINKKSQRLVSRINNRVPIEERIIEIKEMPQDEECTFKPKINKPSDRNKCKTMANNYSTIHGRRKY